MTASDGCGIGCSVGGRWNTTQDRTKTPAAVFGRDSGGKPGSSPGASPGHNPVSCRWEHVISPESYPFCLDLE